MIMPVSFSAQNTIMERTQSVFMSSAKRPNAWKCTKKTRFTSSALNKTSVVTTNNKNHPEDISLSLPISLTRENPHLTTKPLTYGRAPNTSRTNIMPQKMQNRSPEDSHLDNSFGTTSSTATITGPSIPKCLPFLTTAKSNVMV